MGKVRMLTDENGYKDSFNRFEGDENNGWLDIKAEYAGKEGTVTQIFDNMTVSIVFDDDKMLDFPNEAIAE